MEGSHTDVVEDFSYSSRNRTYNSDYLIWRRHTKGAFIYRFTGIQNENVYVDGNAVAPVTAASAERNALMQCSQIIGLVLLVFLLIAVVGGSVLIALLRLFHIDIRLDFLSLQMDGSQWACVAVKSITAVLKYLLPSLLLLRICKLPRRIVFPVSNGAVLEMLAAAGAGMLIAGIYSLTANSLGVASAQDLFLYKDMAAILTYGVFEVLVISMLAEMLLRGCIFPLLRQFGDPFAVLFTALIAAFLPNATPDRLAELLIGLAAGYLFLRAGSIVKCIVIRVIFSVLSYARLVFVYSMSVMQLWEFALLLISIGVLTAALYVRGTQSRYALENRKTVLPMTAKIMAMLQSVTMLPWAAASLLIALLQIFY
ncbi:MAG: CPBP family glutamic-type intramembrane protease [Oscillospiraceae bacterium]|nr:CPBP family glutamic-type intramembrane protease [Oscillospiraceae bacterium]